MRPIVDHRTITWYRPDGSIEYHGPVRTTTTRRLNDASCDVWPTATTWLHRTACAPCVDHRTITAIAPTEPSNTPPPSPATTPTKRLNDASCDVWPATSTAHRRGTSLRRTA